jgi:hypothetical protein
MCQLYHIRDYFVVNVLLLISISFKFTYFIHRLIEEQGFVFQFSG